MLKVPHCPDMEPFPWSLQRAFQNSRERISGNGLPAVGGWLLHRITSPIKHRVSANGDGGCFISGPPQQAQGGHRDKSTGEAASCTMWRELSLCSSPVSQACCSTCFRAEAWAVGEGSTESTAGRGKQGGQPRVPAGT